MIKKNRKLLGLVVPLGVALLLSGCIADAFEMPFNGYRKSKYKEAAQEGNVEAMYEYGHAYCCGAAPFHDNYIATKWLCRAARAGHDMAQAEIAFWWRKESGMLAGLDANKAALLQDNAVAYAWYSAAAQGSSAKAQNAVDAMEQELTPYELDRARKYLAHYPDMPCEF